MPLRGPPPSGPPESQLLPRREEVVPQPGGEAAGQGQWADAGLGLEPSQVWGSWDKPDPP